MHATLAIFSFAIPRVCSLFTPGQSPAFQHAIQAGQQLVVAGAMRCAGLRLTLKQSDAVHESIAKPNAPLQLWAAANSDRGGGGGTGAAGEATTRCAGASCAATPVAVQQQLPASERTAFCGCRTTATFDERM
jgi:hypothetical protein